MVIRRYLEELVGSEVENIVEIDEGWERSLYAFDGGGEPLIARFYQGPNGGERSRWESRVLQAVTDAGIRVPRVDLVSTDESPYGTAVLVMERIAGVNLAVAMAARPELATDMATVLAALHEVPIAAVFDASTQPFAEPEFIVPELTALRSAVDGLDLIEFRPLLDWLDAYGAIDERPASVLHNDFTPENLLIGEDGELTVLDWSFAGGGDHRLDVAWSALWIDARAGSDARARFLESYPDAAHRSIEYLDYHEALRLGARLMTIAAWTKGALDFPALKVTRRVLSAEYKPTVLTVHERFVAVTGLCLEWVDAL